MSEATPVVPAADADVRRSGIGSSDASVIVGLNPYRSALDLYLEKRGLVEPQEAGEAAEWGAILEPVILSEYARRVDRWVLGRNRYGKPTLFGPAGEIVAAQYHPLAGLLGTLRHPALPWMMAHLDGIVLRNGVERLEKATDRIERIVEAKTTSAWRRREWGEEGSDEIPQEYIVQVQHALTVFQAVTGLQVPADVPVLIGGQSWRMFTVHHDLDLAAMLGGEEAEFWQRVERGDPPDPEPDERGKRALARMFPTDSGEEIIVEPGTPLDDLVFEFMAARRRHREYEAFVISAENRIKQQMGEAATLRGTWGHISWKKNKDREIVDWEAVARSLAADLSMHGVDGEARLQELRSHHASIRPGPRVFRPYLREDS